MTTLPPIQPRPILCKTPTTNSQSSVFLVHSTNQPSTVNNTNSDLINNINHNHNNNSLSQTSSLPSTPTLSSSEEFLKRLREFHRIRQTTFRCLPSIAGQIVDLETLYSTVVNHGGWDKVNNRQLWSTIALKFGIDSTCLNGTQALKNIYIRYLYAFEKISNGENIDSRDDDDEDSKRRNVSHLQRVPQSYNQAQHIVSDSLRSQYGLFRDFVRRNEYEKLELALLCGFPNELTFTLNTLLLLSSANPSNCSPFHLYKCPRLLDILFCHIGLFSSTNEHYFRILHENLWTKHLNYHFEQFWIENCPQHLVKQLLRIEIDSIDKELFHENTQVQQQQQQLRIEQILMILRNLSFDRTNALYLIDTFRSPNSLTLKFFLLISYCENKVELQKYSFDIWTNLASNINLHSINDEQTQLIRQLLIDMLNGNEIVQQQDRFQIIRALEILSNLAQSGHDNAIYLIDFLDLLIQRYIHVADILILVHTLECLYQLSELGEFVCNAILKVQSSVSILTTLIDFLTIEARSFSSQTIKTIKIVEMSTGPVLLQSYHQPPLIAQTTNHSQSVVVLPTTNQQQTYAVENTEINKSYYSNNNKLIVQQQSKPMSVTNVISTGNLLATPIIVANTNQKRKHDSISETIAAVVNGTSLSSPPPPKRSRPTPTKNRVIIAPTRSIEDDTSSMESTSNSIQSTMADLLDRCSSPPSIEQDVRICLNDLCQRIVLMNDSSLSSIVYNPIPSPVFKRKIEEQTTTITTTTPKKKRNRTSTKKTQNEIPIVQTKKEEPIELDMADIKPPNINQSDYICEWENCRRSFPTARSVFHHTCSNHVKYLTDYICLWNGCDRIRRQKWALISHIQEKHCSEIAFRQAKFKSTSNGPTATTTTTTASATNATTLGYAPDAAWLAIRRHMQNSSFDDLSIKTKEGPLTKSIRLTAALILRNLARHSSIGKQNLRQYEQHLAYLALETNEASSTLSSCLFELYN